MRQRMTAGLGDEPVTNLDIQVTWHGRGEQRAGVVVGEPFEGERRQGGK